MPVLFLTTLECVTTEDLTHSDSCRLEVRVDGGPVDEMNHDLNTGERWLLNKSYPFTNEVRIKLYDEDEPDADDFLGEVIIGPTLTHRANGRFTLDDAKYILWYEIIPTGSSREQFHRPTMISLRQMLGRLGRGVLTQAQQDEIVAGALIYRCSEYISFRDTVAFHAKQDGGQDNTSSVRMWINRHCNPWGEETVIPVSQTPRAFTKIEIGLGASNWLPVTDEKSYCVAGFQHYSRQTETDYPFAHRTMDWNWDLFFDPPFTYMLNYTANAKDLSGGIKFPYVENEGETGSLPVQWRPFWGEHVILQGRHIHDVGHLSVMPEIHPAHTIVREHTTAAPLGNGGAMVPANRAIIGMGLSGGFPGNVGSRWQDETGANPPDGIFFNTDCWVTNLKQHPLKFQLFPPVPRPSPTAVLRSRIVLSEFIQVANWGEVNNFLFLCGNDDPAEGGSDLGFRDWSHSAGHPVGFVPVAAPAALQPSFTRRHNAYFDVEVNLDAATQIPVGYYAIVECGWSEPGAHVLNQFEVTFETVKAVEIEEILWDDWHMYYGVNGQWVAWWTENFIEEGETYTHNQTFRIWTVDDLPILIRDCGIEWDGFDFGNNFLDRVEITVPGPNYFDGIVNYPGVELISQVGNTLRVKAKGWEMNPEDTKHEWTLRIERL